MTHRSATPRSGSVSRWSTSALPDAAATRITKAVEDTIRQHGKCTLALTGGSTPRPIYERMATAQFAQRVDWSRVEIYFGDERCVPPDSPASNYGMAYDAFLRHARISRASVHRMEGERSDPDAAARNYERILPPALDILLLGMGEDGHTASLFPHSSALAERTRRVVAVNPSPTPPPRITITPPVIDAAGSVIVLVAGANKAAMVAKALSGPYTPDDLPIQLALRGTWLIDHDAARLLGGESDESSNA